MTKTSSNDRGARRRRPRGAPLAGLLLATALLAACTRSPNETACTLIGCASGVTIEVLGSIPEGSRITLTPAHPNGLARSVVCTAESPCAGPILIEEFAPETFTVRVSGEGVDFERTFSPAYTVSRPNGPDCPPECRNATITIDVR